jgi:glycerol kinase
MQERRTSQKLLFGIGEQGTCDGILSCGAVCAQRRYPQSTFIDMTAVRHYRTIDGAAMPLVCPSQCSPWNAQPRCSSCWRAQFRGPRHRRHRQPDDADGSGHALLGRRASRRHARAEIGAAADRTHHRCRSQDRRPGCGIPIAAVIGDQQASLFGQTAFDGGDAKCTFGTGAFLLFNTGTELVRSTHGLISTVAYTAVGEPTVYALEGSIATAGGLVQWCRDNLRLIRTPAEIETLAESVDDNGGCFVVPAFSGLFAPVWDAAAQGIIVGLTGYVTKHHIARAVLESTAWQTRDLIDAMNRDAGLAARSLTVDGGMTSNNLLMQLMADILDMPVIRPVTAETVAAGVWPHRDVLRRNWRRAADWTPKIDPARRQVDLSRWQHAVTLARRWEN